MHLNTTSFDNNYHQTTTHKLLGVYKFFCRRYIFYICYVCTFSQSYYVIFNDLFTFFKLLYYLLLCRKHYFLILRLSTTVPWCFYNTI